MSVTVATPNAMIPQTMDQAVRLAEMMSRGKLVPNHLQSSPGDCLMVIEQASRWGMSPFAVAQSTSVISGKLMFEGKLVAAALNASGIMQDRLDYKFSGDGDNRVVIASGTLRGETKSRQIEVKLKDVKTNNQMWTKQADQQLVYSATRAWARRHAPEVMLGVYSPEEFDGPVQRAAEPYDGVTIDGQAAATPAEPPEPQQPRRTVREIVRDKLVSCETIDDVHAVEQMPQVQKALSNATEEIRGQIDDMLAAAYRRVDPDHDAA